MFSETNDLCLLATVTRADDHTTTRRVTRVIRNYQTGITTMVDKHRKTVTRIREGLRNHHETLMKMQPAHAHVPRKYGMQIWLTSLDTNTSMFIPTHEPYQGAGRGTFRGMTWVFQTKATTPLDQGLFKVLLFFRHFKSTTHTHTHNNL